MDEVKLCLRSCADSSPHGKQQLPTSSVCSLNVRFSVRTVMLCFNMTPT